MSIAADFPQSLGLSATERAIFERIAEHPNQLVTRSALMAVLRGSSPRTIDSHIMAIRRKLQGLGSPATIETVKRQGFILRLSG